MADKKQLEDALVAAHNAGDTEAASVIAQEIKGLSPAPVQAQPTAPLSERLGRQAGLTARYGLEGLGSIVDLAQAPVRGAINMVLPQNRQLQPVSAGGSLADVLGLPQPQTGTERVVGDISRALAGTGGVIKAAGAVSPTSAIGQSIRQSLISNIPTQASSAIAGAGASGITREMGGGVIPQTIAGIAGGIGGAGLVKPQAIGKSQQELLNAPRDKVLKEAQKAGYVALPSDVGAGKFPRTLETVSGKFKAEELASARNQQVTNNLTRKYLGIDEQTPLTTDTLDTLRERAGTVYQQASELPAGQVATTTTRSLATGGTTTTPVFKTGADLIDDLKLARDDARSAWKAFNFGTDKPTQARNSAIAADNRVQTLESQLEQLAKQNKQPELLNQLRRARQEIAKIYTVEKATNPITGMVDAKAIGRQIDKKAPITGDLALVGKFAKTFPKVNKPVAEAPNPFSIYDVIGGSYGAGAGNPLLLGLPLARVGSRYLMESPSFQQRFVQPQYEQLTKPFVPYQGLLGEEQ
jgi:hypothetical protein